MSELESLIAANFGYFCIGCGIWFGLWALGSGIASFGDHLENGLISVANQFSTIGREIKSK